MKITFFYILGKNFKYLNTAYKRIKVPHSFPQSVRDFSELSYWKANELKVLCFILESQFRCTYCRKIIIKSFV